MQVRVCQVKGCFSAKPPDFKMFLNIMTTKSIEAIAHGQLEALVCEECMRTINVKDILDINDWILIVKGLSKNLTVLHPPSFDRSFLSFKKLLPLNVH